MPGNVFLSYTQYDLAVRERVTDDMDVHDFNAVTDLKGRLPLLLERDTFSDAVMDFGTVRASIESSDFYASFAKQASLGRNLDALLVHITRNPIEVRETHANVLQLFSRVWSLARHNRAFTKQLFASICDNTETGSGCQHTSFFYALKMLLIHAQNA